MTKIDNSKSDALSFSDHEKITDAILMASTIAEDCKSLLEFTNETAFSAAFYGMRKELTPEDFSRARSSLRRAHGELRNAYADLHGYGDDPARIRDIELFEQREKDQQSKEQQDHSS